MCSGIRDFGRKRLGRCVVVRSVNCRRWEGRERMGVSRMFGSVVRVELYKVVVSVLSSVNLVEDGEKVCFQSLLAYI